MNLIRNNLRAVREGIASAARRASRDPASITLVAVSKLKGVADVRAAFEAGQADFGENYAQELLQKRDELVEKKIRWHFVGNLQTRKARDIVGVVSLIHSVDSLRLASEINRVASTPGIVQKVLVQVNLSGETSKSGMKPEEVPPFLRAVAKFENLDVTGLMTLPPLFENPEESRPFFKKISDLREELNLKNFYRHPLTELSMGMSQDFEVAIEEGATIVRIGTTIFGERAPSKK